MLRPRLLAPPLTVLLSLLLAACGGGGGGGGQSPSGQLGFPADQWSWVDVPGTQCADGSSTGLAVNPGPDGSGDLLVFLDGGGACWDPISCAGSDAPRGPFGQAEFEARVASKGPKSVLDRTVAGTPFGNSTLVFIPYCTGDVHWGEAEQTYLGAGTWRHAGHANLAADIAWLKDRLTPTRLVVSGASAGGFGSLLAHDLARTAWPDARGYLVDDSGPPLVGGDLASELRDGWYASWGLSRTLDPLCGGRDCQGDLSQALEALAAKYPNDRMALLSFRQDPVISAFTLHTPPDFETALLKLVDQRIAPLGNARAFLVTGASHVLLEDPASHTADGVDLASWLRQMVDDDPGWSTLGR